MATPPPLCGAVVGGGRVAAGGVEELRAVHDCAVVERAHGVGALAVRHFERAVEVARAQEMVAQRSAQIEGDGEARGGDDRQARHPQHGHRTPVEQQHGEHHGGHHGHGQLKVAAEEARRPQRNESASGRAAGGDHHVEGGELPRLRLAARQFAMAEHRQHHQAATEQHQAELQRSGSGPLLKSQNDGHPCGGEQPAVELRAVPAFAVEGEHETQQVEAEGKDPEERHGGDVLAQLVGHRHPQRGGAGGERHPHQAVGPRRTALVARKSLAWGGNRAGAAQQHEGRIGARPEGHLRA